MTLLDGVPLKFALDLIGGGNDEGFVIPGSTGDPGLPGFPLSRE